MDMDIMVVGTLNQLSIVPEVHVTIIVILILIVVHTIIDYLFPAKKTFFSPQYCKHLALPSEFRISSHNDRNCSILHSYKNRAIQISLSFSEVAASLLFSFK